MTRLTLVSLVFAFSCVTAAPRDDDFPAIAAERTLWPVCWTDDGEPRLPPDELPHAPECAAWEYPKYATLPVRVAVTGNSLHAELMRQQVDRAIDTWNTAVGFELLAVAQPGGRVDISVQSLPMLPWLGGMANLTKTGGRLRTLVQVNGKQAQFVLTHEVGHALGLAHDIDDKLSVMHPHDPATQPTLDDARALRWLYGKDY